MSGILGAMGSTGPMGLTAPSACSACKHPAREHDSFEVDGRRGFCNADACDCQGLASDPASTAVLVSGAAVIAAALVLSR